MLILQDSRLEIHFIQTRRLCRRITLKNLAGGTLELWNFCLSGKGGNLRGSPSQFVSSLVATRTFHIQTGRSFI